MKHLNKLERLLILSAALINKEAITMKSYLSCFIHKEDGVETMEWIAIISVTAGLIVIAAKCGNKIKRKLSGIAGSI